MNDGVCFSTGAISPALTCGLILAWRLLPPVPAVCSGGAGDSTEKFCPPRASGQQRRLTKRCWHRGDTGHVDQQRRQRNQVCFFS